MDNKSKLEYKFATEHFPERLPYYDAYQNRIYVSKPYEMLNSVAGFTSLQSIDDMIQNIEDVMLGKLQCYEWSGSEFVVIESKYLVSTINYTAADYLDSTTTICTSEVLRLLKDWKIFLSKSIT